MGNVVLFKNKDSKITGWVVAAGYVNKEYGINKANNWLKQHVPEQFHLLIQKILLKDKRSAK